MKKKTELMEIDGKMVEVKVMSKKGERKLLQERADRLGDKFWEGIEERKRAKE